MTERASIFSDDEDDLDVAGFKPAAAPRPRDPQAVAAVRQTAESRGFVSREAAPAAAPRPVAIAAPAAEPIAQEARLRRRRTGRDKQLNVKVTDACLNQFYALADANGWGLGETFERALAALEGQITGKTV
ncbi:stability/partitioning determinant [Caulobacter sp. S45]|uniref:stability/partitioning determinant n=1 Tax=Caulobacter sp. S45 TaxID=1641861 RepID=UPI00131D3C79|nr:stability/partitioning determinant [Caulobacter sp. S45]